MTGCGEAGFRKGQRTTYQLLPQDQIPQLALPPSDGRRELGVVLPRARAVRGALAHLDVHEQLPDGVPALLEHLLAVDAHVRVLEGAVRRADLLKARDARLDEVLRDTEAGLRVGTSARISGGGGDAPCLHVGLAVLLVRGVVELEGADTGACGEEEGDVLDLVDVLLVGVLEDLEDVEVTGHCRERRCPHVVIRGRTLR